MAFDFRGSCLENVPHLDLRPNRSILQHSQFQKSYDEEASEGPIIAINVSARHFDTIVATKVNFEAMLLPLLSEDELKKQVAMLRSYSISSTRLDRQRQRRSGILLQPILPGVAARTNPCCPDLVPSVDAPCLRSKGRYVSSAATSPTCHNQIRKLSPANYLITLP